MRAAHPIPFAAVATLLFACSDSTGPSDRTPSLEAAGTPEAASYQVAPASATLQQGQSLQFTATYSGNPALSSGSSSIIWHSSDDRVATVSTSGLVRGVAHGQARIFAIRGGYQASAIVTVAGQMKKHEGPTVR